MGRGSWGAPSRRTRPKAPLRRRTSAHQGPRPGSAGRTTRRGPSPRGAQSPGWRVRAASTQATPSPRARAAWTRRRARVVLPAPRGPTTSVSRPRGSPPPRAASRSPSPVGRASAAAGGGATTRARRARRGEGMDGFGCYGGKYLLFMGLRGLGLVGFLGLNGYRTNTEVPEYVLAGGGARVGMWWGEEGSAGGAHKIE